MRHAWWWSGWFAAFSAISSPAFAQEAAPVPVGIAFSPSSNQPLAAVARDIGFVVKGDEGDWRILCTRALRVSANGPLRLLGSGGGGLLLGSLNGLQHLDTGSCDWSFPAAELEGLTVVDIDSFGDRVYVLINDSNRFSVYRSDDAGGHFELAQTLPDDAAFLSLRVAPSDPSRWVLHAVSTDLDAGVSTPWIYVSSDGGASFTTHEVDFGERIGARLLAIDPDDPDRLFVAFATTTSSHTHGDEEEPMDSVFVSDNAGADFELLRALRLFGGFAFGASGDEIFIGDGEGGLHRSSDGGASFELLHEDLHVSCLAQRAGKLWMCADSTRDPFSLGYSEDGGETLTPWMRFSEVKGPLQCEGAPLAECGSVWNSWQFWHAGEPPAAADAGADAGDAATAGSIDAGDASDSAESAGQERGAGAGADAGADASDDDGCGCRVARPADAQNGGLALLVLLALSRRRRRGRRSSPTAPN